MTLVETWEWATAAVVLQMFLELFLLLVAKVALVDIWRKVLALRH
jgi:hypothetical protein